MKHSLVTFGAAACIFVLGCQNQGVNDPVASDNNALHGTIMKQAPKLDPGLIKVNQQVTYTNIGQPSKVMQAVGTLRFHISQVSILSDELFDVEITAKGELYNGIADGTVWSFDGSSRDRIRIPGGRKVQFEKNFAVYGADFPSVLTMQFTITERTLVLRAMSLTATKKVPVPVLVDVNR